MTPEEKLAVLKIMVGSADAEYDSGLLSAYLSIAGSKIISRAYPYKTNITDVPPQYDLLQVEIAAYLINKEERRDRQRIRKTVFPAHTKMQMYLNPFLRRLRLSAG